MSYRTALSEVLTSVVAPAAELAAVRGRFPRAAVTALGRARLLGLTVSTSYGGGGQGLPEAVEVVARTARVCPAVAAVLGSHYAAVAVIEAYGGSWVRTEIAAGRHLSSLALAEAEAQGPAQGEAQGEGDLLAPHSSAVRSGDVVALRGRKHRVVAAGEADSYVWSSRPLATSEGLTLWGVPAHAPDLFVPARPQGAGPYGSGTSTVCADPVLVPADAMLGADGSGLDIVRGTALPWLRELRAAWSTGGEASRGVGVTAPRAASLASS